MTASYFTTCTTAAEIKAEYRRLAYQHHPDHGGDVRIMQAINAAYDAACTRAQRQERPVRDGETTEQAERRYASYEEWDSAIRDAILKIISLPGIDIEVCGWWVWVSGDTRAVKDALKAAGYRWSREKSMWYFPGCPSKSKGRTDIGSIREMYGSQKVQSRPLRAVEVEG